MAVVNADEHHRWLDREFQGSVTVAGKRLTINEKAMDTYCRDTIGYIYQAYNLISHLSVLDNVLIPLDMTTLNHAEREKRALSLLKRVGLADQAKKYPNQLSGGQKQRVAIARALASDPKVIIADEPTGALDSQNTKEVLEILDSIAREGRLVIAVTHSQSVANAGSRIVHLEDGKINADSTLHKPYPLNDSPRLKSKLLPASVAYRTAYKHFKYHFWRNSLIVLGTAIGLFAVMLFSGLGNGISGYISQQVKNMVNPQVVVVSRYRKNRLNLIVSKRTVSTIWQQTWRSIIRFIRSNSWSTGWQCSQWWSNCSDGIFGSITRHETANLYRCQH